MTHSNQALNDLFQKIMERDVPGRYLLRLGMGEEELDTDESFSRTGRVNAMLERRLRGLGEVERLAKSLAIPGADVTAYTCETAGHFWLLHVLSRWEKFRAQCEQIRRSPPNPEAAVTCVRDLFPFIGFFSNVPSGEVFPGEAEYGRDMARAESCFRHLRTLFQELEEARPFEMLRGQADRVNYLMTKQSKIVAMTCTHAALKRKARLGGTCLRG